MYQLIENFIQSAKEMDDNVFPFMANKDWKPGNNVYYSGPYWNDLEAQELIYAVMKGKWLSSGEKVNKFEKEFSNRFEFDHSVMVNSGSSANLVMIAALKKYYGWEDGDEIIDITAEQYDMFNFDPPYDKGKETKWYGWKNRPHRKTQKLMLKVQPEAKEDFKQYREKPKKEY